MTSSSKNFWFTHKTWKDKNPPSHGTLIYDGGIPITLTPEFIGFIFVTTKKQETDGHVNITIYPKADHSYTKFSTLEELREWKHEFIIDYDSDSDS